MNETNQLSDDSINKLPSMRVGDDDFRSLLLNSNVFVDKSLFIKDVILDSGHVILITRPRRWGKSLNMSMLKRFFEIEVDGQGNILTCEQKVNYKLFTGGEVDLGFDEKKQLKSLKIAEHEDIMKRQGKFPVILLNLKDVKGNSYHEIEYKVKLNIRNLYKNYSYLIHSNKITSDEKQDFQNYIQGNINLAYLHSSLVFLNKLLFQHFSQKAYILIDEYDTPINSSYLKFADTRPAEFEQVLELFRALLGSSLKTNPYLEKGVITGILRIAKANLFSDLNNVREYTLLDQKFSKSYGFTQEEVDELLTKVQVVTEPQQIKDWYNGYTFGSQIMYNPWSIMCCLATAGQLDHYWIDSGGTGLIDKVLLSDEIQEDLQQLASGRSLTTPITKQISFSDINKPIGLFSLLLFSGYLNPTAIEPEKNIYQLSIPNNEIKFIYENRVLQWVTNKLNIDSSRYYSFISLLPAGKIEEFKEHLQELLLSSTSFYQTGEKKAELFYSGFMLGLINMLSPGFIIESEQESGRGRADIIMIPKETKGDKALIIEYKIAKNKKDLSSIAKAGLEQIINKQYDIKIRQYQHIRQIIKISMAFCGKDMDLQYQIDAI